METRALLFDVFGTSVDWYGSVTRELGRMLGRSATDPPIVRLTLAWRQAYFDGIAEIRQGRRAWRRVDEIHAEALEALLPQHGFARPSPQQLAQLNLVWHRLDPWPDTLDGLRRLKRSYTVATLSNGNLDLLIDLSRYADLAWDKLFCSDLFTGYKPDPETYLGACRLLELVPEQVMMVACHRSDLEAAARYGLRTAFVGRLDEFGGHSPADTATPGEFDLVCGSFTDLAQRLEAAA